MHAREQIRGAIVTAVTGLTTTAGRVYESRFLPLGHAGLPALCVYTRTDTVDYSRGTMTARPLRVLEVHIEGHVGGSDQSVMDDIAEEVETAIFANATLLALIKRRIWLGEQSMTVDGEGVELVSRIDMVFVVEYSVAEGVPGTLV